MYDIYYAHHQWKYGTKIEEYEINLIKRYFPHAHIFNPSTDLNTEDTTESAVMEECLRQVRDSDILVFSSVDGCVGTGVYAEVMEAKAKGKIIFYIYQDRLRDDFDLVTRPEKERTDRIYASVAFAW